MILSTPCVRSILSLMTLHSRPPKHNILPTWVCVRVSGGQLGPEEKKRRKKSEEKQERGKDKVGVKVGR